MAIFKCKMCGGALEIGENESVATCEYCGTQQTLPRLDNEQKINLYDRANHFRRNNDYDKAMAIYENILNTDTTDAEAYWSILLCRYGVEYVEDPVSHKQVPTINRAQFTSIFADEDYKSAVNYASPEQKAIYEQEAAYIDEVQKGILEISNKEEPFDVFICYKETDANGRRTRDSVLATELYHGLVNEGFKVFFSRITLEDKLGQEYEPYIFAALNSAKVMVVIGTKPDNFNAVWVKNEWSRYLSLVKKSNGQKILIPAYKEMDPYDLPEEFSHLQAQDMSKLGFMQDLIHGIKKLASAQVPKEPAKEAVVINNESNTNINALIKRAYFFLEDGEWTRADEFCEQVLNQNPESAEAYLAKLMIDLKVRKVDLLKEYSEPFDNNTNYQKIMRFGDAKLIAELKSIVANINEKAEIARKDAIYNNAMVTMISASSENAFKNAAELFESIIDYKDCASLRDECLEKGEAIRLKLEREAEARAKRNKKLAIISAPIVAVVLVFVIILNTFIIPSVKYNDAMTLMESNNYSEALAIFQEISDYKDSKANIASIIRKISANEIVSTNFSHTVGVKSDGTVVIAGSTYDGRSKVYDWTDIIAVSSGYKHTIGLKSDGTVVATGDNTYGQCMVSDWTDIVVVSTDNSHTVGLKSDGTVVATGSNTYGQCDVKFWKDIVAISADYSHTVGLKSDGTVVTTGDNSYGRCDVSDWKDVVAISADYYHTVGLKSDGTVVATGDNSHGRCDVSDWTDIVAISAGTHHTVGLKSDGTVVAVGDTSEGRCDVSDWKDIVAVTAGGAHTIGLKSDGTVVAVGYNYYGQCDVDYWKNIKQPF